jgi:hypothetical protein
MEVLRLDRGRKWKSMMALMFVPCLMQMHIVGAEPLNAAIAGSTGKNDLTIVENGKSAAQIVVATDAGTWEKNAAQDLQKYIAMMSGAKLEIVNQVGNAPSLIVGRAALATAPTLQAALDRVAKKNPTIRADAIAVHRTANRVLLAGSNDESHYFAVSWLLQQWGCRWYLPTDFGECIPEAKTLKIGALDFAYAPPFEIRHYWLSWNGDNTGSNEFRRRNFMTETSMVGMGHALGAYTEKLATKGQTLFNVPFSDPKTAGSVAEQIGPEYAAGKSISLAIEDGSFVNDSPTDKALTTEYDRYMLKPSMTDAMLTLYNNVGKILREKYPNSKAKIGGMAYANVTLPPKIVKHLEPNVVMWIAPIDVDPIHGMDDPKSPPRKEYKDWLYAWAKLTEGRLAVYDYDQGMLVWRDLPNPAQQSFVQDVKHYRDAAILGVGTESRGAMATTFLNLYLRGQLMWNPDADVDKMLAEFYPKFYGPAAEPMARYWNAIFDAWKDTIVTEHEYFVAPAIYTPQLVATLQKDLLAAQAKIKPLQGKADLGRQQKHYVERMKFTSLSFEIIENYLAMVNAAAAKNNYAQAAAFGEKALAAREELTTMNGTFTTYKNIGESGPAWFPGEVAQMKALATLTDGTKGTLITQTPLEWSFHRDAPVPTGWEYKGMEGAQPNGPSTLATQAATAANGWKALRTDLYLQAQGVLAPDGQSYTGHYWYQTSLDLKADQTTGKVHLMFPGLFNEAWLYVNGELVAHRDYAEPWWMSDYKFEWDVDLSGKLKPGKNVIALRGFNPHHFGGIFRRPFLYRATG